LKIDPGGVLSCVIYGNAAEQSSGHCLSHNPLRLDWKKTRACLPRWQRCLRGNQCLLGLLCRWKRASSSLSKW